MKTEVLISNIIEVKNPTKELLDYCKKELVFRNPAYFKKSQMGLWVGKTPKTITLFDKTDKSVYFPIGCLKDIRKIYKDTVVYHDFRSTVPRNIKSSINLRDYQHPSTIALKSHENGIILMMCGGGKTECALACASTLGQKTLFIAHTKDLIEQAKERCDDELQCNASFITDGKVDLSGDIVFATVQTLVKKLDEIPQSEFGMIVCDECHHIAANAESVGMFRTCIDYFAARYKLGLTATLHRADGLEACIPKLIGDVIYEIQEDKDEYVGVYNDEEIIRFPKTKFQVPAKVNFVETEYSIVTDNGYRDVFDKNGMTISFSKLITDISMDAKRNAMIISLIRSLKGSTIVLSDRVDQLKLLAKYIPNSVQIDGKTDKKERAKSLVSIKNGNKKVLFASYPLAKEGLDCKILQNVIFATPIKDEAIVIQCIGRAQRPYPHKDIANVYDFVDDVSMLKKFYTHRKSVYKKKGWI